MKNILLPLLLILSVTATAQNINGTIVNEIHEPLPAATVMLLKPSDSTLFNFTVSDDIGNFEFKNIPAGQWLLKVTYIGYKTATLLVKPGIPLQDNIRLEPTSAELDAVTVQGEHIPVTVKKDTIEYNARAFRTKENAVVEDLLKRLPGVVVNDDGAITAQGEQVSKVTVDGKEFFGRDPKLATRNLPADAVEKVQVIDGKSEQARFSGIDDGDREKTINLELKEDRKNGFFGSATAGAGTEGRLEGKTNINRFTKGSQLSFLGMANNTNQQGFSMSEYLNFNGTAAKMMSGGGGRISIRSNNDSGVPLSLDAGGNGIMTTAAGGVNYNREFNEKTDFNSSYFLNKLNHNIERSVLRENYQADPDNNFNYYEDNKSESNSTSHRGNVTVDYRIDSASSVRFTGNINYSNNSVYSNGISSTLDNEGSLQNKSDQHYNGYGKSLTSTGSLLLRHRFPKKGRTISINTGFNYSDNSNEGHLQAINSIYTGLNPATTEINQDSEQQTFTKGVESTISYTEPLGNRMYLEANLSARKHINTVDQKVYDLINEQKELNETLSNLYESEYDYRRGGLNFMLNRPSFNLTTGLGYQSTELSGDLENVSINHNFSHFLPVTRFSYEFSSYQRINVDYETSIVVPAIQQLQPVVDNSNPLNIYEGNPNLKPSYQHGMRISYNTFNPMKFLGLLSFINILYTENAIINAQHIDEHYIRYTTPVNIGGSLSMNANINLSFPVTRLKSRLNFGTSLRDNHSAAILNDIESKVRQTFMTFTFRYSVRIKETVDLDLSTSLNREIADYALNQPDQAFMNNRYSAETNISFLKNYNFSARYDYRLYSNQTLDFEEELTMLDLSLSRSFMKNKKGELKFSVNNLLNENTGVVQNTGINYTERQVTNSLGRYFMFTFTYAINNQLNPMGKRGGGIMIRR